MQVLILYSTTTRRTEAAAGRLADGFSAVCDTRLSAIENWDLATTPSYDLVIAGGPTAGQGELHLKWRRAAPDVAELDMQGRHVALFALGDQRHHGATFGNALWLLEALWSKTGASMLGQTRFDGYLPKHCPHLRPGQALPGLLIDHVAQRRQTSPRVDGWVELLQGQLGMHAHRRAMP